MGVGGGLIERNKRKKHRKTREEQKKERKKERKKARKWKIKKDLVARLTTSVCVFVCVCVGTNSDGGDLANRMAPRGLMPKLLPLDDVHVSWRRRPSPLDGGGAHTPRHSRAA